MMMLRHQVCVAAAALAALAASPTLIASVEAEERRFVIAAVEPKGGVTADLEPFPTAALPDGGGYVLKAPDQNGRWEVSAYVWMPSQIVVNEGDEVVLDFVGINGAHHPTTIAGYDKSVTVMRGHVTTVTFTADRPGVFAIACDTHRPSMIGELVVLAHQ
jgi:plastocyanin